MPHRAVNARISPADIRPHKSALRLGGNRMRMRDRFHFDAIEYEAMVDLRDIEKIELQ
ncbi:MAG TPA: hypothetical protein VII40_12550 [Xanthobacteraceae bacterium]|jgi:hypothetical protein